MMTYCDQNGDEAEHRLWRLGFELHFSLTTLLVGVWIETDLKRVTLAPFPALGITISWLSLEDAR